MWLRSLGLKLSLLLLDFELNMPDTSGSENVTAHRHASLLKRIIKAYIHGTHKPPTDYALSIPVSP